MSTGTPALVAMLDDVGVALDALAIPDKKLILFGRSVGSIYALHAAHLRPNAAGLILESGIFSVEERIRVRVRADDLGLTDEAMTEEARRHFDHGAKLRTFTGRTLVLHTLQDALVGVHHARQLHAAANEPRAVQLFERGGHNDIFAANEPAYTRAVRDFLGIATRSRPSPE